MLLGDPVPPASVVFVAATVETLLFCVPGLLKLSTPIPLGSPGLFDAGLIVPVLVAFIGSPVKANSFLDLVPVDLLNINKSTINTLISDAEERLNLQNMKAKMNQRTQDEKLEQNEELAELRADTSIEKTEMTNEARERLAMMKPRGNRDDR